MCTFGGKLKFIISLFIYSIWSVLSFLLKWNQIKSLIVLINYYKFTLNKKKNRKYVLGYYKSNFVACIAYLRANF